MKILAVFFLATMVGCYGDESCIDEKAESCVVELLSSIVDDDAVEYKVCKEIQKSIECLENSIKSCAEGEVNGNIKKSLEGLKMLRSEDCKKYPLSSEEHKEIEKCFQSNEAYFFECLSEGSAATKEILGEEYDIENIDEGFLQCSLYGFLSKCFIDRITVKCGDMASEMAKAEFNDYPEEIRKACEAVGDMDIPKNEDFDKDKRE